MSEVKTEKISVYLLSKEQADELTALNKSNLLCVIMDYGHGRCVGVNDLDHEAFAEHKAKLMSFEIEPTEIEIEVDDF